MIPVKVRNQIKQASILNSKLGEQGYCVVPLSQNTIKVYCQHPELLPKTQNVFCTVEMFNGKILQYHTFTILDGIEYVCLEMTNNIPEGY